MKKTKIGITTTGKPVVEMDNGIVDPTSLGIGPKPNKDGLSYIIGPNGSITPVYFPNQEQNEEENDEIEESFDENNDEE